MTNIDPLKDVKDAADAQWGWVRRTLSAHPLTGAWAFYLIGLVVGMIAEYQLFLSNSH